MRTLTKPSTVTLSQEDAHLVELSRRALQRSTVAHDASREHRDTVLRLSVAQANGERAELAVPDAALPLLVSLLTELGQGKAVALVTTDTEITTQQAADFMNVSRPYLVKLVDHGKIPARKVGVRRRVRLADVLHYMEDTGDATSTALDEMAAEHQALGLYP